MFVLIYEELYSRTEILQRLDVPIPLDPVQTC